MTRATGAIPERPLRVMQSFRFGSQETNPYLTQLVASLPAEVEARGFSWKSAVLGRQDAIHLHWPETLLRGTSPLKVIRRRLLFSGLLVAARLRGTALVRTAHNEASHEPVSRLDGWLLRRCDAQTSLWIRLSDETRIAADAPVTTIPHGHYRDWFAEYERSDRIAGRVLFFGLIRPYKGVPALAKAFSQLSDPEATLRIVGKPNSAALETEVTSLVDRDDRISARFGYVDDAELVAEISAAQLVVLPYEELHNSGVLLLALSLGTPVLVPDGSITRALADEVGPGWVHRYSGSFEPEALRTALDDVRGMERAASPDLSRREWPAIGASHAAAYRRATERHHHQVLSRGSGSR